MLEFMNKSRINFATCSLVANENGWKINRIIEILA